jgi:hypothetical protein
MSARIVIQLLIVPILIVAVPLMFILAWLHEAIGDLVPGNARSQSCASDVNRRS